MDPKRAAPPVAERAGERLADCGETLAVAESCTGGLVGSRVTDVPGASEYFDRSCVTYTYRAKRQLLGVDSETLEAEGAVSESVGHQMAQGVRDTAETDWGLSTTGVAGPERPRSGKPVGTVYVGVARADDPATGEPVTTVERYQFDGTRTEIKERVARQALADLLDCIGTP
jgi:nicotinamide-nucleotide amidase